MALSTAFAFLVLSFARADTVYLKNGNQLEGTIASEKGGELVLNIGYDNMQRQTSLSATVAGTLDFLNNYAYNADSAMTQIT